MSPYRRVEVACLAVGLLLGSAVVAPAVEPALVISTFSSTLPSGNGLKARLDLAEKKAGLASAALDYRLEARNRAEIQFPPTAFRLPAPGVVHVWVKGDQSGNRLWFLFTDAKAVTEPDGGTRYDDSRASDLQVTLDFDGWRECTFDLKGVGRDRYLYFRGIAVDGNERKRDAPPAGTVWVDEMTLVPVGSKPTATAAAGLLGSRLRVRDTNVVVAVDVRNFTDKPFRAKVRMTLTDWNDTPMADRDTEVRLGPGEATEVAVPMAPDTYSPFLPPFRLRGDVLSPDAPDLAARLEETIIFGNSCLLFEPFADVYGGWGMRGQDSKSGDQRVSVSESYRFTGLPQTSLRLSRADIAPAAAGETNPPASYAMRVEFDDSGTVFNMRPPVRRYLPGDAFRAGFWVKGDGSGARISAILQDFSDMADFYEGGWKRTRVDAFLCTLDFTGWRYVEVGLPGNGLLTHLPKGSTHDVDFPLELAGFEIEPAREGGEAAPRKRKAPTGAAVPGVVELGPVFIHTQQRTAEALAVFVAYDDAEHRWAADRGAVAIVQNGSPWKDRKLQVRWSLVDRAGAAVASGTVEASLKPEEQRALRLDLAARAAEARQAAGPLRLQVVAVDTADSSVSVDQEIILSKPDSRACFADFEQDRTYGSFEFVGLARASCQGIAGRTVSQQAHSGKRSLELTWMATNSPERLVSIDPPLPGLPVALSMWVYGDGSGVQFYPLIGDRNGVAKGATRGQWDVFTLRTAEAESHEVVTVDWTGWRELKFTLPPIPPSWNLDLPVLSFVPSYPLGLHLVMRPGNATNVPAATLYVDDIVVETHLPPAERVGFRLDQPGESNVLPPGGDLAAWVWSSEMEGLRKVTLAGGLRDWRGRSVCSSETALELKPGEVKRVTVASRVPPGAYTLSYELREGTAKRGAVEGDLLAADLTRALGDRWHEALAEAPRLRGPIGSAFELVDEDWDWVEHYPGNFQAETVRGRSQRAREEGGDPFVLLGYSAYWASGEGYQARQANAFTRRPRDAGHAVDIFMKPERLDDWDNYVCDLMRSCGKEVAGWILWDNPDGAGPLAMKSETFVPFLKSAWRWRNAYCPDKPLLIGGMQRDTAVAYLEGLAKTNALHEFSGVQVRLDLGRLSPEDAQLEGFVGELRAALHSTPEDPRQIFFTDLDWAVEKGAEGLGVFDQAAYLARATLLLNRFGYRPSVTVANGDFDRFGLGVAYRQVRVCPPMSAKPATMLLKPGWWGLANLQNWRREMEPTALLDLQDIRPGRSVALLYKMNDGRSAVVAWRNDDAGSVTFEQTGYEVMTAEDVFGAEVKSEQGAYAVGKIPVRFVLKPGPEAPIEALSRVRVRDAAGAPVWPQQTLAAFAPVAGGHCAYRSSGGTQALFEGRTAWGERAKCTGMRFAAGGSESFELAVPAGAGLVLRKGWWLDETGHTAEVWLDGKPAGTWNLKRASSDLSSGLRESVFPIPAAAVAGKTNVTVEMRYPQGGTTARWWVFEHRGGVFPLTAVGAVHADQNVGAPRPGRNTVGGPLKVGEARFGNGLGCFAMSLQEFSLGGRFKRFTAKVGVDAVTEGRGSVVFEVYGDGKKLWASPIMSGLDPARAVEVPVEGVDRLRLVVGDAGDGNRYDVADWCDPAIEP